MPGLFYVLPENKRVWVSHRMGDGGGVDSGPNADAMILECAPSVYHCASHRYLPVDPSQDKVNGAVILQRRNWHVAPDGVHVGWTDVSRDAMLMFVGRLQRLADKYKVVDERIVNPSGPSSPSDTGSAGWARAGQLYELKSFADGGASIVAFAEPEDVNFDLIKINLATGAITRLTHDPDWDEEGAPSPDGTLLALGSSRTRDRIAAFGWIPEIPPFIALPQVTAIGMQYVTTFQGFQCDLAPWLLPGVGDGDAPVVGQPLDVFGDTLTSDSSVVGQPMWSPDSTEVLIQERTHLAPLGLSTPHRILIDRIERRPAHPQSIVRSNVGSWAPTPAAYRDPFAHGADVRIKGPTGGAAHLVASGNFTGGSWQVTFRHYSSDGKTFLDGSESAIGSVVGRLHIKAALSLSGDHTGSLAADVVFDSTTKPVPTHRGTYVAVYDGKAAPASLPNVAPCYGTLPRAYPLRLQIRHRGSHESVTVTADISGDIRPVAGAQVTDGRATVTTDGVGRAMLQWSPSESTTITATAGYTFLPVSARIARRPPPAE